MKDSHTVPGNDSLRLYLSPQTTVRVWFIHVGYCSKMPVTPDLPLGESEEEESSAPELMEANIPLVKMEEDELADEEIEHCTNEVLGSLMEVYRVAGIVPDIDYNPGVSVGLLPFNDPNLAHYTDKLIATFQECCTSTSPTSDLTAKDPEREQQQSINNVEGTYIVEIPAFRKLSSATFQSSATENVGEVLLRALRMQHFTDFTQ